MYGGICVSILQNYMFFRFLCLIDLYLGFEYQQAHSLEACCMIRVGFIIILWNLLLFCCDFKKHLKYLIPPLCCSLGFLRATSHWKTLASSTCWSDSLTNCKSIQSSVSLMSRDDLEVITDVSEVCKSLTVLPRLLTRELVIVTKRNGKADRGFLWSRLQPPVHPSQKKHECSSVSIYQHQNSKGMSYLASFHLLQIFMLVFFVFLFSFVFQR